MNIITKFCTWYVNKQVAKAKKEKAKVDDAKLVEAYKNINALYDFCKFLRTTAFKSRDEKKKFWRAVLEEKPVISDILNRMLQAYGVKSETIKLLEKARIEGLVAETKAEIEKNNAKA